MSGAATTAGTGLSLDAVRRAALALLVLLGIAAIIMPEQHQKGKGSAPDSVE